MNEVEGYFTLRRSYSRVSLHNERKCHEKLKGT